MITVTSVNRIGFQSMPISVFIYFSEKMMFLYIRDNEKTEHFGVFDTSQTTPIDMSKNLVFWTFFAPRVIPQM